MPEISEHIARLQTKLQQLLKQHEALLSKNTQQEKLLATLREKDKQQAGELEILRDQHLILKASMDQLGEKDKKEMEQKINGYIRNIDKCISLLSHEQPL